MKDTLFSESYSIHELLKYSCDAASPLSEIEAEISRLRGERQRVADFPIDDLKSFKTIRLPKGERITQNRANLIEGEIIDDQGRRLEAIDPNPIEIDPNEFNTFLDANDFFGVYNHYGKLEYVAEGQLPFVLKLIKLNAVALIDKEMRALKHFRVRATEVDHRISSAALASTTPPRYIRCAPFFEKRIIQLARYLSDRDYIEDDPNEFLAHFKFGKFLVDGHNGSARRPSSAPIVWTADITSLVCLVAFLCTSKRIAGNLHETKIIRDSMAETQRHFVDGKRRPINPRSAISRRTQIVDQNVLAEGQSWRYYLSDDPLFSTFMRNVFPEPDYIYDDPLELKSRDFTSVLPNQFDKAFGLTITHPSKEGGW